MNDDVLALPGEQDQPAPDAAAEPAAEVTPAEPAADDAADRRGDAQVESGSPQPPDPRFAELAEAEAAIAAIGNPHAELIVGEARRAALSTLRRVLVGVLDLAIGQQVTGNTVLQRQRQERLAERERLWRRAENLRAHLDLPPAGAAPGAGEPVSVTPEMVAASVPDAAAGLGVDVAAVVAAAVRLRTLHRNAPATAAELAAAVASDAAQLGVRVAISDHPGGGGVVVSVARA